MSAKSFSMLAAVIFALGAVVQFLRIVLAWEIVVNGTPLPYWPNWVAVVVLAALSLLGFRAAARG
jgi:cytochrome c biogenesis protein CcdA